MQLNFQNAPLFLKPKVQHYAWGKKGSSSLVAQLSGAEVRDKPYAELWVGAHAKAPAEVVLPGAGEGPDVGLGSGCISLADYIAEHPIETLGDSVAKKFGKCLPFLFKVLSIAEPLSIQAHPHKELAEKLHQRDPQNYPDDNHKPEVAVALNNVELLYGFKAQAELEQSIRDTPELASLIGEELCQQACVRSIYRRLFEASKDEVGHCIESLCSRLQKQATLSNEEQWLLRLKEKYPDGDVGMLCFYLLNYDQLQTGEAIFIGPNIPHAYLGGELVECMANSDNVVRAGLTEKHKDVGTLVSMLSYEQGHPRHLRPEETEVAGLRRFSLAVAEFSLGVVEGETSLKLGANAGHKAVSILFALDAKGTLKTADAELEYAPGAAILLPAALSWYELSNSSGRLFRASVPV